MDRMLVVPRRSSRPGSSGAECFTPGFLRTGRLKVWIIACSHSRLMNQVAPPNCLPPNTNHIADSTTSDHVMQDQATDFLVKDGNSPHPNALQAADLKEARRYLPLATEDDLRAFAARQLNSRVRLTRLVTFYRRYKCRMARVHLLAACAVALGRLAGVSENFDKMGDAFMPVNAAGEPKNQRWRDFVDACQRRRPIQTREELWLAAHMRDLEDVQRQGLDASFYEEATQNLDQTIWRCAKRHMEVTLGARLRDSSALAGLIPYETAMADSLAVTFGGLVTGGARL